MNVSWDFITLIIILSSSFHVKLRDCCEFHVYLSMYKSKRLSFSLLAMFGSPFRRPIMFLVIFFTSLSLI
jgi:hypothetical protein